MGPQNHKRDALVAECERLWQFSTKSYVKRASLLDEKQQVDAEKAGIKSKTHCNTLLDDGTSTRTEFTPEMRSAEFAALETRNTAIRTSYTREKKAIYTEMTGKDTVPTVQSTTIMEWPEGDHDDVQCAQLESNWISFTKGKEDQFDLVFQGITRLFVDYIPMGDNRHQFDTADLVFDDTKAPEMKAQFAKQDGALFKLLMADLPGDHSLRSRFMGGVAIHHMGSTASERYRVLPNSACSLIRAILLMDKPLLPSFKKTLERNANSMTHRFKKGSPKKTLGEALAILSKSKNHQVSVQIQDWLHNTLTILEVRFPNQYGKLKQTHADDSLNTQWNGMPDITEVLSTLYVVPKSA